MAITAVPNLSDLVLDYTIDPGGTGGAASVPTSRLLLGTLPIRINGGASADLSADDTISVNTFGAAAAGIVPLSGGGTTNFLRADGTWANPVGSGGYTTVQEEGGALTQRGVINFISPDITAADNSGSSRTDVTLTRFSSVVGGTVPASGGSPSAFLCADGTWKTTVGAAGEVSLQGTTPGATDVGNAHISGTFLADTVVGVGTSSPYSGSRLHTVDTTGSRAFSIIAQANGASATTAMWQRRTRGTEGAPSPTQNNDTLGSLFFTGYNTNNAYFGSQNSGLVVYADGNAAASEQPAYMDVKAGAVGVYTVGRFSQNGLLVKPGALGTSDRATSTLQNWGSLGLKYELFSGATSSYTVGATSCIHLIDSSAVAGTETFNLPTASGIAGRIYGFVRTDIGTNPLVIDPSGAESISGAATYILRTQGEALLIVSDGTNWQVLGSNIFADRQVSGADLGAISNSAAKIPAVAFSYESTLLAGAVYSVRASGMLSTTGTPTIRFSIENGSALVLADSGSVTCPAGVTNVAWQLEFEGTHRTGTPPVCRVTKGVFRLAQTAGLGASMNSYNMMDVSMTTVAGGMIPKTLYFQWGTANPSNSLTFMECIASVTPKTSLTL